MVRVHISVRNPNQVDAIGVSIVLNVRGERVDSLEDVLILLVDVMIDRNVVRPVLHKKDDFAWFNVFMVGAGSSGMEGSDYEGVRGAVEGCVVLARRR